MLGRGCRTRRRRSPASGRRCAPARDGRTAAPAAGRRSARSAGTGARCGGRAAAACACLAARTSPWRLCSSRPNAASARLPAMCSPQPSIGKWASISTRLATSSGYWSVNARAIRPPKLLPTRWTGSSMPHAASSAVQVGDVLGHPVARRRHLGAAVAAEVVQVGVGHQSPPGWRSCSSSSTGCR